MTAFSRIWSALASLADNLTALSATVADVNRALRTCARLDAPAALDAPEGASPPQIAARANGSAEPVVAGSRGRKKT
jgi:hypothetical protein